MTRQAALMGLSQNGGAADRHHALAGKMFGDRVFDQYFGASHFHRWKKFSVGKLGEAFGLSCDADEIFDVVIPGSDVRVANGPVDSDAFLQIRFEIEIAPTIGLTAPNDGTAADLTAANP